MPMVCGGITEARKPSQEEKEKLENFLNQHLDSHIGYKPQICNVVLVATQLVAGLNYFAKVEVGSGEYVHARIYEKLPCHGSTMELHGVQKSKNYEDKIDYF